MKINKVALFTWIMGVLLTGGLGFFLFTNLAVKDLFLNAKADRLLERGRYDDAITTYERLIEIDPTNSLNYWNMAVTYLQKGDVINAKKQVVVLRKMNEKNLSVMLDNLIERSQNEFPAGNIQSD